MEEIELELELPALLRHRALLLGSAGKRWLSGLDALIIELEKRWQLEIGAQISGGTEALVFSVTQSDSLAVLKIGLPGSLVSEARTLELAKGRGYARLLAFDEAHDAILLERLGESLADSQLPTRRQIEIICATLKRAWRPIDATSNLTTGATKARRQAEFIGAQWRALNRPCSTAVKDCALDYATRRAVAFDPASSVLVHGDAHIWNTLRVLTESSIELTEYKLVDPDGLFAEPGVDLAVLLREWRNELTEGDTLQLGRERCALLGRLTEVPTEAIWQWGFIEHVSCGLLDLQLGDRENANQHFTIANAWLPA